MNLECQAWLVGDNGEQAQLIMVTEEEAKTEVEHINGMVGFYSYGVRLCGDPGYREDVDPRWGIILCRRCFYDLACQWQEANRAAGLCRCGRDTLPDIGSCRECNARQRRRAAATRNAKKKAQKQQEQIQKAQEAHEAVVEARRALLESITPEQWKEAARAPACPDARRGTSRPGRIAAHLGVKALPASVAGRSAGASAGVLVSRFLNLKANAHIKSLVIEATNKEEAKQDGSNR